MGYRIVKFNMIPGENEEIDAHIKIFKESRSIIHGVVVNECNEPMRNAIVKLLKENGCNSGLLEPITHTFTDEHGQFLFGPLCSGVKYVVKVWVNSVKTRKIEIKTDFGDDGQLTETPLDYDSNGYEYKKGWIYNMKDFYEDDEE